MTSENGLQTSINDDVKEFRRADYPIDAAFLNRWSPRAFSPEPIDDETLMRIFEHARWAASSFNEQPWRFIIARSEEDRERFLSFLFPANQEWAKSAPVLALIVSKKTFSHNGKPNRVYQFDAGTASGYMTLGATLNGLYAHGMAGFDQDMARAVFGIPDDFEPIAAFAIGHKGDINSLPEDVRKREIPSGRRPIKDSVMEGRFVADEEREAEAKTENS